MSEERDSTGCGSSSDASQDTDNAEASDDASVRYTSRLQLIWAVFVFQFKLAFDGLRDVILAPVSVIAALAGLLFGGNDPGAYYRKVLKFGRRTEFWINLFDHPRRAGTSDELLDPIRERVLEHAGTNPLINEVGSGLNRSLDQVSDALNRQREPKDPPES